MEGNEGSNPFMLEQNMMLGSCLKKYISNQSSVMNGLLGQLHLQINFKIQLIDIASLLE